MEPQAGGACRAGNIYNLLQRVLYRMVEQGQLEYAQIPVISLNLMGEEKHTGFRITPSLLSGGIAAGCYGDLIMCLGNDDIESFLLRQGMEPYSGGFVNYCLYLVDTERYKAEKYQHNPIMAKACAFVLHRLCEAQKHLLTVIGETDRFQTDLPFPELKEKVQGILAEGCNTGDGWLIAAEVIQYVEKGCGSVLILHPFGCLVSHVCERGILQRLHARFPDVSIQTIEYDYDQSKTLRESRILLAIS